MDSNIIEKKNAAEAAEYIRVDEDDLDEIIRVYDSGGEVYREFSSASKSARRYEAEAFAAAEARRLGCGWGSNYFN